VCAKGRYGDQTARTGPGQCKVCAIGKYSDQTARTGCKACALGKRTPANNNQAQHDNRNDCKSLVRKSCQDGDVRVHASSTAGAGKHVYPEVNFKGKWYPICGHYFWDDNMGANKFCRMLGFHHGTHGKTRKKLGVDSMPVGRCGPGQRFNKCNQGGHAWGNFGYRGNSCRKGRKIGVTIKCTGGRGVKQSCVDTKWKLMFRQTAPKYLTPVSKWESFNANKPKNPNYSILSTLGNAHKIGGKFTFKIVWPRRRGKNYNVWRQSTNPVQARQRTVGYEAVDVNFRQNHFGGLENGYKHGGNNPAALLDGSVNHGNWYYAIGSRSAWGGGIPGASSAESRVELYVAIPAAKSTCPGDFNGDNRVDAKDLLSLLGRFAAEKSHTYMGKHKGTKYNKLQGKRTMCTGDLQGDGALDVLDLLKLLQLYDTPAYRSSKCDRC